MAGVTPQDVLINGFLTDYSLVYRTPGLVAQRLFPVVPTDRQFGTIAVWNKEQWLRAASTAHAPGESPKQSKATITTVSYFCPQYAFGAALEHELQDNSDIPSVYEAHAGMVLDRLNVDFEIRAARTAFSGVGSSLVLSGAGAFSALTSSSPTSAFNLAAEAIRASTGYRPNLWIVPQPVINILSVHPEIGGKASGNFLDKLAGQLQCDRDQIAIPTARPLNSQEGQPQTYFELWSSNIIAAYVSPAAPFTASFAGAIRWRGRDSKGGPPGITMWQREDGEAKVTNVFGRYAQMEAILQPELGFLIATG